MLRWIVCLSVTNNCGNFQNAKGQLFIGLCLFQHLPSFGTTILYIDEMKYHINVQK